MSSPHIFSLSSRRVEADIIKKNRFFHAYDQWGPKPLNVICMKKNIKHRTGQLWLRQRRQLKTLIASRRISKRRSERPRKISDNQIDEMLNFEKNPVRDQTWEMQIDHFQLNCTRRTLQRKNKQRSPSIGRYVMSKVKFIGHKNQKLRYEYEKRHENETMKSFWQYVHFTNEAHIDPNQMHSKRIYHEEGTRYESEICSLCLIWKEWNCISKHQYLDDIKARWSFVTMSTIRHLLSSKSSSSLANQSMKRWSSIINVFLDERPRYRTTQR